MLGPPAELPEKCTLLPKIVFKTSIGFPQPGPVLLNARKCLHQHLVCLCAVHPCSISGCRAGRKMLWSFHKLHFCLSAAPSSLKFTSNPVPSLWLKLTSVLNLQKNLAKKFNLPHFPLPYANYFRDKYYVLHSL